MVSSVTSISEGLVKQYMKLAKSLRPDKVNFIKQATDAEKT